jgi:hypothetical protein
MKKPPFRKSPHPNPPPQGGRERRGVKYVELKLPKEVAFATSMGHEVKPFLPPAPGPLLLALFL